MFKSVATLGNAQVTGVRFSQSCQNKVTALGGFVAPAKCSPFPSTSLKISSGSRSLRSCKLPQQGLLSFVPSRSRGRSYSQRPQRKTAVSPVASSEGEIEVLVVGGGGREHALVWKLAQSPLCGSLYCAPGNPGIAQEPKVTCVPGSELSVEDSAAVVEFCKQNGVGLVVVGPEVPLVAGLADALKEAGVPVFGPSKAAAQLEGSKKFMKDICSRCGVNTAKYVSFSDAEAAKEYIKAEGAPIVVKADGLAAGKGVIVCFTEQEALDAVDSIMVDNVFGEAGGTVVIEEFMEGEEASFFAVTDGKNTVPLVSAQDHKAVGEGDTGPNTGGMGAYSPAPIVDEAMQQKIMTDIVEPTVKGMAAEGVPFSGVLFAGLMIQNGVPRLLEYNVRFGDPECQTMMMRMESDILPLLLSAAEGNLEDFPALEWSDDTAMVVVYAAKGYPGSYEKGTPIKALDAAAATGAVVFHAGTAAGEDGGVVATGGRVLGVTSMADDVKKAADQAYAALDAIDWPEGFCRRDIGWRAIKRLEESS